METTEIIDSGYASASSGLSLTSEAIDFLDSIRKWAKFLAIIGFIGIGFMVILGLFMGTLMSAFNPMAEAAMPFPTAIFTVFYIAIAALYFFPVLYLFNFSTNLSKALINGDSDDLTRAFSNLKSHYKFIGIIFIVLLSIYALIFVGGLFAAVIR